MNTVSVYSQSHGPEVEDSDDEVDVSDDEAEVDDTSDPVVDWASVDVEEVVVVESKTGSNAATIITIFEYVV